MAFYEFNFDGRTFIFDKDESDADKYIVFACAKNEDKYILQWVEHYLELGFDKVIIADNNDEFGKVSDILKDYVSSGKVQIFNCQGLKKFQLNIYNMFLEHSNYKWCAYFDCDEFLELSINANIKEFLNGISEDCVLINWIVFGSNEKLNYTEGKLIDRFKVPVMPVSFFKENFYVKPIIRGGLSYTPYMIDTHCPLHIKKYNIGGYYTVDYESHVYFPPRCKYAFIRHFYTKSFDEWMTNKTQRGWPDEMINILRPSNYFIADKNPEFMVDRFINGFFIDNNEFTDERIHERYDDIMSKYEVIVLKVPTNNMYALFVTLFSMMKIYTNHIFVIECTTVDDSLFNLFLEYSFITGNKVVYSASQMEINLVLWNKAKWNNNTFYYFTCL